MILAITGLFYLGMFALAAGMSRHIDPLLGTQARRIARKHLALAGRALVTLSLLLAIFARDGGQALVLWFGLIPLASAIILLGLTYRPAIPRAAVPLAALMLLLAPFV